MLFEPEGEMLALISNLVTANNLQPSNEAEPLVVSIDAAPQGRTFTVGIEVSDPRFDGNEALNRAKSTLMWDLLADKIPILTATATSRRIAVTCATLSENGQSFADHALRYFYRSATSQDQDAALAHLLHDLKNQLVAFHACLSERPANDRTKNYRMRYLASEHLDRANAIVRSIGAVADTLREPVLGMIDPGDFFRQYAASKIASLPRGIRLDPPRTLEPAAIRTDKDMLLGILENLVKNSVEAMPEGGEIRLDWLYERDSNVLVVEVVDNGPGMASSLLEKLVRGAAVKSVKAGGSVLGCTQVHTWTRFSET
jgi:signal transduction histidine kinase